jgi:hypothetical protein
MNRCLPFFAKVLWVSILVFASINNYSQTSGIPEYFYSGSTSYDNGIPLNGAYNKVQWLYSPGAFSTNGSGGTQVISGNIENIYFEIGAITNPTAIFSDFTIKLAQNVDSLQSWNSKSWNSGMTTVFYQSSIHIDTGLRAKWMKIPLQSHFKYNPNLSLVVEMSVSSGSGCNLKLIIGNNSQRIWGDLKDTAGTNYGVGLVNLGMDIIQPLKNNAGILHLQSPVNFCEGKYDIKVNVINSGVLPLDSVKIVWSVDSILQSEANYNVNIDTLGSSNGNVKTVFIGYDTFPENSIKNYKIWTSYPNGVVDSFNRDDTIKLRMRTAMKGNYTIGGNNADYVTISNAVSDLNEFGVCGPVYFKISPGTYTERLVINNIGGVSSFNTVVFDGIDTSSTTIQYTGTGINNMQTILLNGANFVTFKNLTIKANGNDYGIAVHLVGSSNNTIDSCAIIVSNAQKLHLFCIVGSGSITSPISGGNPGDSNTFSNLNVTGGYYGLYYAGSFVLKKGIKIINNTFQNFSRYGLNLNALENLQIINNIISSQVNANIVGVFIQGVNDFIISGNYVYTVYTGFHLNACNYYRYTFNYRSLFSNNMIINTGSFDAAMFFEWVRHINVYHNSTHVASFNNFFLKESDSIDIMNNIFKTSSQWGMIFQAGGSFHPVTTSSLIKINYNVYECNTSSSNYVAYGSSSFSTISDWFSSITSMNQNSLIENPGYVSNTDLHLKNGYKPKGTFVGVQDDIDRNLRCLNQPTIGAQEVLKISLPDSTKASFVCIGDTLSFEFIPPAGLSNNDYGSKWILEPVSVTTQNGTPSENFSISSPGSSGNGKLLFFPNDDEKDSAFLLFMNLKDLSRPVCDTLIGKFIRVIKKPALSYVLDATQVCLGNPIVFTNTTVPTSKYFTFEWDMGNGFRTKAPITTYTYPRGGVYQVLLSASSPGCSISVKDTVRVGTVKGAEIIKGFPFHGTLKDGTLDNPDYLCIGDTVTLQLLPPTELLNSQYSESWEVEEITFENIKGTPVQSNFTALPDSSQNNYKFGFAALSDSEGDTIIIQVKVSSLLAANCDTTLTRYLIVKHKPPCFF